MNTKNLYFTRLLDAGKDEENKATFVASTNTEDRYGDVINQRGWRLDSYKRNPVVLLNHDATSLPIGKGDVALVDNQLMIEVEFDMEDKKAAEIARKVKKGFISAVSVGFNSKDSVYRSDLPKDSPSYGERGLYFKTAELLEVSIVTIPANPQAIAAKKLNIDHSTTKDIAAEVAKHIISVLEEDGKFIVTYASHDESYHDEEIVEEEMGYGHDDDKKEDLGYGNKEEDEEDKKYYVKKTNFPKMGEDEKISMRNSQYKSFPLDYAMRIREEYPNIWRAGGNIKGNAQFAILSKIQKNNGVPTTSSQEDAIKLREAWAARHLKDFRLAGVVAQMKWLVIGSRGLSHMKNVINEQIKKDKEKSYNEALIAAILTMKGDSNVQ